LVRLLGRAFWALAVEKESIAIRLTNTSDARPDSGKEREIILREIARRGIMGYSLRERGSGPERPVESGVRLEVGEFYHDNPAFV
jgi:hypothetical protein